MRAKYFILGGVLAVVAMCRLSAQAPVLSNIESPYAAIQSPVTIAGATFGAGTVTYGPAGTPLVLTGTNLGSIATVEFIAYQNGVVDTSVAPAVVQVQPLSSLIFVSVPTGAMSGLIKIVVEGRTSNGLPFIVTPGSYSASCPAGPVTSQLQITTGSLSPGMTNQPYSATLSATGGSGSYTWSLTGGSLPAGLSISAAGLLSGTPTTAAGPLDLTFKVTDTSVPQQSDQAVLSLTIESQGFVQGTIYQYTASYDPVGNVAASTDTVNGAWSNGYDTLNRLALSTWTPQGGATQYLCWQNDSFGNRLQQEQSSAAFQSGSGGPNACTPQANASLTTALVSVNSNNQVSSTNARGVTSIPTYDGAGNIRTDGLVNYLYDIEGRICAVQYTPIAGRTIMTGYLYDADGNRIAKGTITSMNCDPSANGFALTASYLLGPGGEELTTQDGNGNWQRTNVYAGGKLLATYDAAGLHFHLTDPLGTRRVQISGNTTTLGQPEVDYQSLPYGDGFTTYPDPNATSAVSDSTPLFFTGKERDTESGNDYFGARYFASSMGRFLSPDHPFVDQHPDNPQSWNLYAYSRNNPLINIDPTGLGCITDLGQGSDANHEKVEFNNSINSDDCAGQHGTWVPGDVSANNTGAYRGDDGSINFQATTNTDGNVYYSSFRSGAQTDEDGTCLNGCQGASIAHAPTDWLSSQIAGGSLPGLMSFAANRFEPRRDGGLMALLAGPGFSPDAPDNWAGPGGMGTPQGQGDWAAMAHDYNYHTNGITLSTYFNPFVSRATAKALIQSDNYLIGHAGGAQAVKMGMFFGVVNAFQWAFHPYF